MFNIKLNYKIVALKMNNTTYTPEEREFIRTHNLTPQDLQDIVKREKTVADVKKNYDILMRQQAFVPLVKAATEEDGIVVLTRAQIEEALAEYAVNNSANTVQKFTPASGAASRMFGALVEASVGKRDISTISNFFDGLDLRISGPKFAFIGMLEAVLKRDGLNLEALLDGKVNGSVEDRKIILDYVLNEKGLNFVNLPKALIPFHTRDTRAVLSLEEQMKEALAYGNGVLHLTVSPEHYDKFIAAIEEIKSLNPTLKGVKIYMTDQLPSTDSIAIDPESKQIVRDQNGRIAFFPAGHGSLSRNIPSQFPTVLRNIDNVPKDANAQRLVEEYHKVFAVLMNRLIETFTIINDKIHTGDITEEELDAFLDRLLSQQWILILNRTLYNSSSFDDKKQMVLKAIHRPIRIVGVVKNEGEPGGGPFVIGFNGINIISIVEKDEISPDQKSLMRGGSYFNPVDILVDTYGHSDLSIFTNEGRFFIVEKPYNGKKVRRMEHPGLWNGTMDGWTTLTVAIPIETFAPVKEVVDLLRSTHQ